jgi:hypothetical protein
MSDDQRGAGGSDEQPLDSDRIAEMLNEQVSGLTTPGPSREAPRHPVVWGVGIPRSGSTLLAQLVAETRRLGYPSNLVARFWENPAFGLRIQQALAPVLERGPMRFESSRGRTEQWFAPHEFGYYWERHFPFEQTHQPSEERLREVDWAAMRREIAELEAGFGQPMFFKNLTLSLVVDALAREFPGARFVEVRREPAAVANSLYRSRLAEFDDPEEWFSIRPSGIDELQDRAPVEQVVGQMEAVEGHLREVRGSIASERWLRVRYRDLCENPSAEVARVLEFAGCEPPEQLEVPSELEPAGVHAADPEVGEAFREALAESPVFETEGI